MSTVRQRKTGDTTCDGPAARGGAPTRYQKAARPPARPTRGVHIGLALVILAFMVIYGQRNGAGKKKPYTVEDVKGGRSLPEWYAVCSKEGKKVYTVPVEADGGAGAVECVVVGGKEVVETGSLAKIRRTWGEKGGVGAVDESPEHIRKAGGLTFVYLPPGHTLTPGFTDAHGHPLMYGYARHLPLAGTTSVEEIVKLVEAKVEEETKSGELGKDDWIVGMGWDQTKWPVKEFPTAVSSISITIANTLRRPTWTHHLSYAAATSYCCALTCTQPGSLAPSWPRSASSPLKMPKAARSYATPTASRLASSSTTPCDGTSTPFNPPLPTSNARRA